MPRYNQPFEIHIHGDVPLREEVGLPELHEALRPLWKYAGAKSLADGAASQFYEYYGFKASPTHSMTLMVRLNQSPS